MYLPTPGEGGSFTPVPAGTHLAICYRVIDLGTQVSHWQGEQKIAHKIMLSWEIPEEKTEKGDPLVISQFYTWSMHEKATLRKHLEAWRGLAFSEKDFGPGGFDIKNVIGKACVLTIVQETKNGTTYSNISSVGKTMKGMTVPEMSNAPLYLWLHPDRFDQHVFAALSDKMQEKIRQSPEYKSVMQHLQNAQDDPRLSQSVDPSDDIPF